LAPYNNVEGVDDSEALAQRIGKGDRAAEAELVGLYCDCVFAMALSRTRNRDAARELMDEILMAVITALRHGSVRNTGQIGGFVRGTATNIINGYIRAARRTPRTMVLNPDAVGSDPTDDYEMQDRRDLALKALELLNVRDRQILQLSLVEGLKPAEIAAKLGISPVLARQRKCRALRAIVIYLDDDGRGYLARRLLRL
jgi:RNA polymerase sigma factor (sigma-70 family)